MATVKAQQIPQPQSKVITKEYLWAQLCFYYPAYRYDQAKKLPANRINQMLKVAHREEAKRMFQIAKIVGLQNTKAMEGVWKDYLDIIDE